jgi:hypothetical protein
MHPYFSSKYRAARIISLTFAAILVASTPAPAANGVCLYQSRTYSEGAFICVQRSLMQTCTTDGASMVWKIVADREIGDRCVAPLTYGAPHKRWMRHARIVRHAAPPAEPVSAKCFVFNGKRYCE